MTTLEDLIRDGLDVEAIPPGTAAILHARHPLTGDDLTVLHEEINRVQETLGIKLAVVSHEFDVILLPDADRVTVNGIPGPEISR